MKITGYLQTVSPIHITAGSDKNVTDIATETVPDYQSGKMTRVPFVPPTVLRGLLRKTASDLVSARLLDAGIQIPAEVFNAMRHGSDGGHRNNDTLNPAFFDAQRGHPVMGLFGGGPRQASAGALVVAPLYPLCAELLALSMVEEDPMVATPPQAYTLINDKFSYPKIDMAYETGPAFDVIENRAAKTDEMIAADTARRVKGKAEVGDSSLRIANLLQYRHMVPGALLALRLSVDTRTPDHVKGFLIKILAEALNRNQIGGMQRIGMGADVFSLPSAANRLKIDGEDLFDFDGERLVPAAGGRAEQLVAAFDAWEDDGKAWTADSLWKATGFEGIDLTQAAVKKGSKKDAKAKAPKKSDNSDAAVDQEAA